MPTPATSPTGPVQAVVTKTTVDWQHVGIALAYIAGVGYGAKTLVLAIIHGQSVGGMAASFGVLAVTAVVAFLKAKPGSWAVAFTEGDQVGEGSPPQPPTAEKTT